MQKGGSLRALGCGSESVILRHPSQGPGPGHRYRTKAVLPCDTLAESILYGPEKDTSIAQIGIHWALMATWDSRQESRLRAMSVVLHLLGRKPNLATSNQCDFGLLNVEPLSPHL